VYRSCAARVAVCSNAKINRIKRKDIFIIECLFFILIHMLFSLKKRLCKIINSQLDLISLIKMSEFFTNTILNSGYIEREVSRLYKNTNRREVSRLYKNTNRREVSRLYKNTNRREVSRLYKIFTPPLISLQHCPFE
jgi:hypothetical protein